MSTYERVTFIEKPAHCPQRIYLCITRETPLFLTGTEVDRYGDEVTRGTADIITHVISKDMLKSRVPMVMSKMYGWLEKA